MFNHARTLLVNLTGSSSYFANIPGDELIPATFSALELPTYLDVCRSRIFGTSPDRAMRNYRAAQLLSVLEATDLQEYVLELDSRITYVNSGEFLADNRLFKPTVRRVVGDTTDILSLVGQVSSPDASGLCQYRYDIEIDGTGTSISVTRQAAPTVTENYSLSLSGGLSEPFVLPYSDFRFRVNTTNPGAAWTIRGFNRPQTTIGEIATSLESVGEPVLLQLFGTSNEEPYRTFKNCWENHPELAYRLGGLVLAMIYRTNEIYVLQGGE